MKSERDWTGSWASALYTQGANGCTDSVREKNDYYATQPEATEWLCRLETFVGPILEPACGEGHIAKVLKAHGYKVESRDIVNRGYGDVANFLAPNNTQWYGDIITNPPYRYARDFVEKALRIIPFGNKVAMFLKLTFMESNARRDLFLNTPPKRIWVSSGRLACAKNGDFKAHSTTAIAYAWYIWEKGWEGDTIIKWFN